MRCVVRDDVRADECPAGARRVVGVRDVWDASECVDTSRSEEPVIDALRLIIIWETKVFGRVAAGRWHMDDNMTWTGGLVGGGMVHVTV